MKLLLAFLLATFLIGGLTAGRIRLASRSAGLLVACVVVGAMFYSVRVL